MRWTKNLSLFEKDFIIVPINEGNTHWTLAIICYPGAVASRGGWFEAPKQKPGDVQPVILHLNSMGGPQPHVLEALRSWCVHALRTLLRQDTSRNDLSARLYAQVGHGVDLRGARRDPPPQLRHGPVLLDAVPCEPAGAAAAEQLRLRSVRHSGAAPRNPASFAPPRDSR